MRKALCVLPAFLLALCLAGTASLLAFGGLQNRALHVSAAEATLALQTDTINAAVDRAAEQYGFTADALRVDASLVRTLDGEAIDWWLSLLSAEPPTEEPAYSYPDFAELALADEAFLASVDRWEQTTVARDGVAADLEKATRRAVMPVRASMLLLARDKLEGRADLPGLLRLFSALRWILGGAAFLCAGLLLLLGKRDGLTWLGAGLAAGGLLTALLPLLIALSGLVPAVEEISAILAAQLRYTLRALLRPLGLGALLSAALGWGLIAVRRRP